MVSLSHSLLKNATSPFYTLAIKLLNDITGERQALRLFALLNQRPYNTYALVTDFPTPRPALLYNWSLIKVPHSNRASLYTGFAQTRATSQRGLSPERDTLTRKKQINK